MTNFGARFGIPKSLFPITVKSTYLLLLTGFVNRSIHVCRPTYFIYLGSKSWSITLNTNKQNYK